MDKPLLPNDEFPDSLRRSSYIIGIMSEAVTRANLPEYSVSEVSAALKRTVEDAFPFVRVRGEVSKVTFQSSGHVYFDLKDDLAVLNAVCWRMTAQRLKVKPQQGLEVVCTGRISTYAGSSRYQLIVDQVELAGLGALMALLEERKKKLAAEGLFAADKKRKLPFLPEVIGVITSPTGAVIRDIMHRLDARFSRRVLLWPVSVQGEWAAAEVAAALRGFNAIRPGGPVPRPDLLIVARGGGSIEDLMAFNEESVVRAVFEGTIPLISAVGHETDTTLIDFVSDMRAPTPTAAAEMAVPVRSELLAQTLDLERRFIRCFTARMDEKRRHLAQTARVLPRAEQLFAGSRQRLDFVSGRLNSGLRSNLQEHSRALTRFGAQLRPSLLTRRFGQARDANAALARSLVQAQRTRLRQLSKQLDAVARVMESVSFRSVLERGFVLVRGEGGRIRRRAEAVLAGETLALTFADGVRTAVAEGTVVPKTKKRSKKPDDEQDSLF
jgi:exodeoxyribonuclease VII large subunit